MCGVLFCLLYRMLCTGTGGQNRNLHERQSRSQGLSSSRPFTGERRDPALSWSPDFSRLHICGLREGQVSGEFVSTHDQSSYEGSLSAM